MYVSKRKAIVLAMGMLMGTFGASAGWAAAGDCDMQSLIVQGTDRASVRDAVESLGGQVTHELGVIQALGVRLPANQQEALGSQPAVGTVFVDQQLAKSTTNDMQPASWQSVAAHAVYTQQLMGTEVTVAVLDSGQNASVVVAQISGAQDAGSYLDAISAIDWAIANKDRYDIRVLKLSFKAPPASDRGDDPLNQAVLAARKAQIEVFAAANTMGI